MYLRVRAADRAVSEKALSFAYFAPVFKIKSPFAPTGVLGNDIEFFDEPNEIPAG